MILLKIAQSKEIGDEVLTVGNAYGEGIALRGGQIASFTPENINGKWNFIRFSAPGITRKFWRASFE